MRLPTTQNGLQEAIMSHRSNIRPAFYGPKIKFTTTRGDQDQLDLLEEEPFQYQEFDRIRAIAKPTMMFHATLDISASLLTKGKAPFTPVSQLCYRFSRECATVSL